MGLPPAELHRHSQILPKIREHLFNEKGEWISRLPMPKPQPLEVEEKRLTGRDKAEFVRFMKRILRWDPAERATAAELCEDPFLVLD